MRYLRFVPGFRAVSKPVTALVLLGIISSAALVAWAGLDGPRPKDNSIAYIVSMRLRKDHLSRHPLDDEISERAFELFFKSLDPAKVYFLDRDIEAFRPQAKELDDMCRKGDIKFAYAVFKVFLARLDERIKWAKELIAMEHDFSVDEEYLLDRRHVPYPSSEEEARELWRKRIKLDLLFQKADGKSLDEARKNVARRYHLLARRWHQADGDELLELFLSAITMAFDPHTTYMSPSNYEDFLMQMRLNLEGIGAKLQAEEDGTAKVTEIVKGGAADKAGQLKAGDKIIGVSQGEDSEPVETINMPLKDVVAMIRGKAGTVVRLKVIVNNSTEVRIYNITREKIELSDAEARGEIIEAGKRPDGTPYRIGCIVLPSFYMDLQGRQENKPEFKSTTRDMRKILADFRSKNVDAVLVDLRFNGGGSLTEAINATGLFIDRGCVVQVKDSDGTVQPYEDSELGTAWDGPLVVVTNKFSASASEIFAGAIQDYARGIVVGDKTTYGKGTVQTLIDLSSLVRFEKLGALKLTIQQFYRPSGESTQERGVVADIELPSLYTHMDVGEADSDFALKFDRVAAAEYSKTNHVSAPLLEQLRRNVRARIESSREFQKTLQDIAKYVESKKKPISLNEQKFLAQRAKDEEKDLEDQLKDSTAPAFKRDYYGNELLAIAADYARLLSETGGN